MREAVFLLLGVVLFGRAYGQDTEPNITYRWVYRNPLSILANLSTDDDRGMGSYYGTRNSPDNFVENTPQIALAYNHGASFTVLPNGSLAAIWQASIQWWEGSIGQSAYWSLSNDEGDTWGPPRALYANTTGGGGPIWGPQIHIHNNTLFMFFSGTAPAACSGVGEFEAGTAWAPGNSLMFITSTDNGQTWSNPKVIYSAEADGGIAKLNIARVTVLDSGAWLLPFWREASGGSAGKCWGTAGIGFNGVPGVFRSLDQGQTWEELVHVIKPAAKLVSKWLIENAIVQYRNNRTGVSGLLQVFRDDTGNVWQSRSLNDGRNWTDALPGPLISPDSKTDVWPLPGGGVVAAFNNATTTRQNLSLATTADGGETWQHLALIEGKTTSAPPTGSFSYPGLVYLPKSNRIIVGYSVGYKSLPGRAALLSNAKALAPGVYDPDINDAQLAPDLPPGVQPRRRRQGSPAAAPATGSGQPAGLRRRLAAFSESLGFRGRDQARRLLQVPFQHGAWGNVSYGIRIAYLDASAAFQTLQSAAAGSQSSPPNAVAG